jgi:hypothetical protein
MNADTDRIKRAFCFDVNWLKTEARMGGIDFEELIGISCPLLDRWGQCCQEDTKLLCGV